MFVPTIKYKRVNDVQDTVDSVAQLRIGDNAKQPDPKSTAENEVEKKPAVARTAPHKKEETVPKSEAKREEPKTEEPKTDEQMKEESKAEATVRVQDEATIEIDPSDKERIVVTLTSGKRFTADRYCPHAGADLSYLGEVAEDEYPPEIGPVLMCTLHYWEFILEKDGRSGNGWATLDACPVPADQCPAETNKKLDW